MNSDRKEYWAKRAVLPVAIVFHRVTAWVRRVQETLFHQRGPAITWLSRNAKPAATSRQRILAVVAHITAPITGYEARTLETKIERVRATLDGLLTSFAHCDLEIVLLTYRDQHVIDRLPEYQQRRLRIVAHSDIDPMFVEFRAQDLFFEAKDRHDWFLFLEDDLVIRDSTLLDKLAAFNAAVADDRIVLVPHRFEFVAGAKTYVDLYDRKERREFAVDLHDARVVDGITFAEWANPHAGMYCLTPRQLDRWDRSGRHWYNKVTYVGPLESAATGCLYECFVLYKPGPADLHFLEVEHLDEKYSRVIAELKSTSDTAGD